jgi:nitrate reductase gamma subunit
MVDNRPKARVPIPSGYRQGVISGITVLLGFSLLFLRYWSFEAPGELTRPSAVAGFLLLIATVLEFYALWRALQIEDDDEQEYRKTLRWFVASIFVLLGGMVSAALASAKLVIF